MKQHKWKRPMRAHRPINYSAKLRPPTFSGDVYAVNGWELDIDAVIKEAHENNYRGDVYAKPSLYEESRFLGGVSAL